MRTLSQLLLIKGVKAIHKSSEWRSTYTDSQRPPSAIYKGRQPLKVFTRLNQNLELKATLVWVFGQ